MSPVAGTSRLATTSQPAAGAGLSFVLPGADDCRQTVSSGNALAGNAHPVERLSGPISVHSHKNVVATVQQSNHIALISGLCTVLTTACCPPHLWVYVYYKVSTNQ